MGEDSFLKHPERRNYQRVDVDLKVNLNIDGKSMKASASNLSCGGLFLPTEKLVLQENSNLEMTLHLPDQKKPIKVFGTPVHREGKGVAVQFQGLYDENIMAIDHFIKNRFH